VTRARQGGPRRSHYSAAVVRAREAHGKRRLVIAVSVISCLALVESATFSYMLPGLITDLKLQGNVTLIRIMPSLGALLVVFLAGALGSRWGHRRTMTLAAASYTVGAAVTATATGLPTILLGVLLADMGRSTLFVCGIALLGLSLEGKDERASAFATYSAILPVTFLTMPICAGWLIDAFGWRSVAVAWVIAGLVALVVIRRGIPSASAVAPRAELITPALAGLFLVCLVQAINTLGRDGPGVVLLITCAIAAAALAGLMVAMRRIAHPTLSLAILRSGGVLILLAVIVLANFANLWFYLTLAFQQVFQLTTLQSALLALPAQAATILAAAAAGWLVRARSIRFAGTLFLVAMALTLILSATLSPTTPLWLTALTLALFAAASTGAAVPITNAVMDAAPRQEANQASSFRSAASGIGSAISVTLTTTIVFGTMVRDLIGSATSVGIPPDVAADLVAQLERGAELQQIADAASRSSVVVTVNDVTSALDAAYMNGLAAHGMVGAGVVLIVAVVFNYAAGRQQRASKPITD